MPDHTSEALTGDETEFWTEAVSQAIDDLNTDIDCRSKYEKRRREVQYSSAVFWLFLSDDTDEGSFEWLCNTYAIEIDAARIAILSKRYGKENARAMLELYNREKAILRGHS